MVGLFRTESAALVYIGERTVWKCRMEKSSKGRINPVHRRLESSKYLSAICLYFSKWSYSFFGISGY